MTILKVLEEDGAVHEYALEPGVECPGCQRTIPKVKADSMTGPGRARFVAAIPAGQEDVLDDLLVQIVTKYQEQWPLDYAAMRNGVGLEVVGGRAWKWYALHFAAYAVLMAPGLEPETGE